MSRIGYIIHKTLIYSGTIEENITMFNDKLDSRVEATINEVNFDKDIKNLKMELMKNLI